MPPAGAQGPRLPGEWDEGLLPQKMSSRTRSRGKQASQGRTSPHAPQVQPSDPCLSPFARAALGPRGPLLPASQWAPAGEPGSLSPARVGPSPWAPRQVLSPPGTVQASEGTSPTSFLEEGQGWRLLADHCPLHGLYSTPITSFQHCSNLVLQMWKLSLKKAKGLAHSDPVSKERGQDLRPGRLQVEPCTSHLLSHRLMARPGVGTPDMQAWPWRERGGRQFQDRVGKGPAACGVGWAWEAVGSEAPGRTGTEAGQGLSGRAGQGCPCRNRCPCTAQPSS